MSCLKFSLVLLSFSLLAACGPVVDNHPGQPVTKRKIVFDKMMRAIQPMGRMVRGRDEFDAARFHQDALAVDALAKQPWVYFPAGSYYVPSRAKPAVWQNPAEFKLKQQQLLDASAKLSKLAQSDNLAEVRPAYVALIKACNDCHTEFRRSGF